MNKGLRFGALVEHHIRRGDDAGGALRSASYTANSLNQYTSRDVPAYLNVLGIANANASVTVNSQSAYRKGEYFQKELSVNNASAAVWQAVTNIASLTGTNQTNTGNLFLPKTAEAYAYDLDGNLTSDGRWTNKWDAENRLIDMTSHSSGPSGSRKSLQFAYDSQGRRYSKVVSNWTGSAWTRVLHEKFLYDGWNLLGAFNGTNAAIIRSFLWGLDLSGSMQGAGGVGGLIAFRQHSGSLAGSHFAAYDGNGNVMALVDGKTGSASARYEYDPFGQTIRASGTMATVNPVRFSSKVVDDETDYAYYGYRYLNPSAGRWLSRDPIEEEGGINTYTFIFNSPTELVDVLGLVGAGGYTWTYGPWGAWMPKSGGWIKIPIIAECKGVPFENTFNASVELGFSVGALINMPGFKEAAELSLGFSISVGASISVTLQCAADCKEKCYQPQAKLTWEQRDRTKTGRYFGTWVPGIPTTLIGTDSQFRNFVIVTTVEEVTCPK